MGDHESESTLDSTYDGCEPAIGEFSAEAYDGLSTLSSEQRKLAEKRRRAEQRLEEFRLREELGDYDLKFNDE